MKVIMRLNAESSSRPLTPSPLSKREAGECKAYLCYVFRVEGNFSSPASPKRRGGGTGAGWYIRQQPQSIRVCLQWVGVSTVGNDN